MNQLGLKYTPNISTAAQPLRTDFNPPPVCMAYWKKNIDKENKA